MSAHLPSNATPDRIRIPIGSPAKSPRHRGSGTYRDGSNQRKRDLIAAVRVYGWKGKSYRKAKRFARKLERERGGAR